MFSLSILYSSASNSHAHWIAFLLEVIAEAPVAEHLEHRVVVRVDAHFLQVVVLPRNTQALLRIGDALVLGGRLPRKRSLNWFMPALVNINVGSSFTTMGALGTMVWPRLAK
jgi:hypothetical protein